ncbi:MAG: glutamine amidotransferase subunit PdxT [Chlamydiales bacterium 38-26]|nr:pyridoxal 5'-phosphate synthase glutaminase subunit PdxT [Chlamydiales bacterium]OJV10830.1 MAG: glutamine amidotransferase subunit PdxT [Chlamydiales bacterium 38-26]
MALIGVLALQGAFAKHIAMLESIGVRAIEVRKPEELAICQGLIMPGGESTTMKRQIEFIHLQDSLKEFSKKKPIFGTCAGLILMSHEIIADPMIPFDIIDVSVERNAFGRQHESFTVNLEAKLSQKPESIAAVFIRAPRIRHCGPEVEVLACYEGEPVLVKQGFHLAAAFHPELTHHYSIHKYFASIVEKRAYV